MTTSSASLEHAHEHESHGLELHVRVARARACSLMFILSDVLSVFAILAAGGYLSALNTEGQFRAAGDNPAAFLPGLLIAIALVLSGLGYYWWDRRLRQGGATGQQLFFVLSWVLMIAAMVGQTWISVTLNRAYTTPYDAYESVITLLSWFTAVHLLLTAFLGLLLFGRGLRGRLVGFEYLVQAAGYWWYYTVIASLLMWLFSMLLS
ncbi:MAG TPA: hypothetical protein VGT44_07265 [Ktedonobacteraceae bacterium]|nr:hypothetical protein [Ktedonobacteraceae bacterium]